MKLLLCVFVTLVAMAAIPNVTARRFGFRLPLPTVKPKPISCNSVLVKLNPTAYPHCKPACKPGPWKLKEGQASSTCASGRRYVLTRTTCPGLPGTKTVCEPTIAEKAQNFVDHLNLGDNTPNVKTINRVHKARRVLAKQNTTLSRGRRSLSVPCPSNQGEKAVCQDILANSCRGKRSAEDIDQEKTLLADFVQAQEHSYANSRSRRNGLPAVERNVFFAVDSSGSIGYTTYQRVLQVLADFSGLFCGDASVGLVTYSRAIDLEFCPTCLRNLEETQYRQQVASKIKAARYHRSATNTGETVKCFSEVLLPSPDCRELTKPTQIVFFTDGRENGCTKASDALASLTARYPTLETYAIGMGSVQQSGITDLLSNAFDPDNIFNVQTIGELEQLLDAIKDLINTGSLECSPVTFG